MSDKQTFDREVKALKKAMEELEVKTGIILTLSSKDSISDRNLKIYIIPISEWLLK